MAAVGNLNETCLSRNNYLEESFPKRLITKIIIIPTHYNKYSQSDLSEIIITLVTVIDSVIYQYNTMRNVNIKDVTTQHVVNTVNFLCTCNAPTENAMMFLRSSFIFPFSFATSN